MRGEIYFDERERRRHRRILKLKIYGGIAAFFVLLIGIGYLIVYSPLFRVTRISADSKQINADEIVENLRSLFANQSKIAQFLGPDNILIWNNEKIGEILKNYPQITELTIEKDYLEREIKVIVKEREKLGIWCLITQINADNISENQHSNQRQSASCMWFDKNGIIFEEAPSVEGNLINKIDDFSGQSLKFGESVLKENFFPNLVKIFEVLEKSDLKIKSLRLERLELQEIIADSPGNSLPKIYFSLRIDPGFSLSALESFKNRGIERLEYLSVRAANRAYHEMRK